MLADAKWLGRGMIRGLLLGAVLGLGLGLTASAQPRGDGGGPEAQAKIGAAQAKAVAADLKLDADKTAKLVEAYGAFQRAAADDRPTSEGGCPDAEALRKWQEERQAKLAGELKSFLDEAQAKAAADTLAGFNRGWNRMVGVLLDFNLDPAKESEALGHTLAYTRATSKAFTAQGGDRDAMREEMMAARKTLDESIAPLLTEEQKAKWTEETSWGRRGGGAGGGGGERRNRGGDGT